ncbi:YczE/YyaS/YitT family protein [Actinobacillus arthritidis]|uniref:membrane protein YczE n=1 Tax=Actinobacillus arthritidis TaxID=157339 RepID=UPI002441BDC2|nr:YitT family protein [Actinobacillus arthritidis]WGE88642.1 YitT family protein [Actinobacillus arthritidis]
MSKKSPIPFMRWSAQHQWELRFDTLLIISLTLICIGIGEGLLILANLGATPWTVLSQGLALQLDISIGTSIALISFFVLLLWIPFKLRFGLGTLLNIFFIALFADLTVNFLEKPEILIVRIIYMLMAILIFGIGTAMYLSCRLGAGPRDGLMVGICLRYGWKISIVRTSIEVFACIIGILLGGTFGISTILFALSIGWLIQITFLFLARYFQAV